MPECFRIRAPRLRFDELYALWLQGLLKAMDGVSAVRVNSAVGSIVIRGVGAKFDGPGMPHDIVHGLEQAVNSGIPPRLWVKIASYAVQGLNSYEVQQVQEIKNCWTAQPVGVQVWLTAPEGYFSR